MEFATPTRAVCPFLREVRPSAKNGVHTIVFLLRVGFINIEGYVVF
jgi:hypothetical protein